MSSPSSSSSTELRRSRCTEHELLEVVRRASASDSDEQTAQEEREEESRQVRERVELDEWARVRPGRLQFTKVDLVKLACSESVWQGRLHEHIRACKSGACDADLPGFLRGLPLREGFALPLPTDGKSTAARRRQASDWWDAQQAALPCFDRPCRCERGHPAKRFCVALGRRFRTEPCWCPIWDCTNDNWPEGLCEWCTAVLAGPDPARPARCRKTKRGVIHYTRKYTTSSDEDTDSSCE